MSTKNELSIEECKKILKENGKNYSDEEIIQIRDWLSNMADIIISVEEEQSKLKKLIYEKESHYIHSCFDR